MIGFILPVCEISSTYGKTLIKGWFILDVLRMERAAKVYMFCFLIFLPVSNERVMFDEYCCYLKKPVCNLMLARGRQVGSPKQPCTEQ